MLFFDINPILHEENEMESSKFKLALIQIKGAATNDENLKNAVQKITEAALQGADIVVLPEMFSCPYKASNFPVFAQKDGEQNWKLLSETAAKNKIYLVAGSMPERDLQDEKKIYNTSYVFDRDGKQIAKHRKMHLFSRFFAHHQRTSKQHFLIFRR